MMIEVYVVTKNKKTTVSHSLLKNLFNLKSVGPTYSGVLKI